MLAEPTLIFHARCNDERTASGGEHEMSALMERSVITRAATADELARHHNAMSMTELRFLRMMMRI